MFVVLSTATWLRISIAAVVLVVNTVFDRGQQVLPWVVLVVGLDLATGFLLAHEDVALPHRSASAASVVTTLGAVFAGICSIAGSGGLPLFVIPLYRAGELRGRSDVGLAGAALALGVTVAHLIGVPSTLALVQVLLWGVLAGALGILTTWEARLNRQTNYDAITGEAAVLLDRLSHLAVGLDGGLDPRILAERILDELPRKRGLRGVVLAGAGGTPAIPIALRGASRVPWPQFADSDTSAHSRTWADGTPSRDLVDGRATVAVPLRDVRGCHVGMLLADWPAGHLPSDADMATVTGTAARHGTGLAVALTYDRLREQVGVDERRLLARAMHDGIAQEVAALGFHLDMIRYAAEQAGDRSAPELATLRGEVARILGDLRNEITDLRIGLHPERGLGAAISTRLQQFGANTGAIVTVVLHESGFRLPASTEIRLYRLLLDVLADAHRHRAREVGVELVVSAPHYDLITSHSGVSSLSLQALCDRVDDPSCVISVIAGNGADQPSRVRATASARRRTSDSRNEAPPHRVGEELLADRSRPQRSPAHTLGRGDS